MNMKKIFAVGLAAGLLMTAAPVMAEETAQTEAVVQQSAVDAQKLDACYTLALNAINAEDYATAKEYLNICFVYCDPQTNAAMYADLLLKQACIDVIEEKNDMALLNLDAALRVQPELADAYLVRTQVYTALGEMDPAIENLEKYIDLTKDASLYETVAALHEANGNMAAAQDAYDKFAATVGEDNQEAGFQAGLYRMENGKYEEAIEAFQAYAEDETFGAGAQYNIGVCKMNMGDYAGAFAAFTACEEKGGTYDGLYYNRGICSLMSEDWAKGGEDFTKSIETESFGYDARYNLGICKMQQEEYEAAVTVFDELIALAETEEATLNDAVYYFRAVCNAALGNLEEAIQDYTTCIEHGYELAQTYYQRAQVYAAMGDTEKQTSDLESSLKYTK
ncbi:MAG: tetratricopeptide repeat protein [Clostridia bacterium]|nr:tetratricopeptide repeat protein [Clostridia bacterium]